MANKRFWLGMLVVVLTFGMMVVGCDAGDDGNGGSNGGGGGTEPALNGTWTSTTNINGGEHIGYELQIRNGNWEAKYYGSLEEKGTANNGIVTKTHIHGNAWSRYLSSNPQYSTLNYESKWYSQDEAQTLFNGVSINLGSFYSQFSYYVDGNVLTWGSVIYTKK